MKRLFDLILASLMLLVFLPAGLLIVLILKLTGDGSVFFVQRRLGKNLGEFPMIKFTSMRNDPPGKESLTIRNDPRVFPFGRLLRKAKLNEVPQLLNVLRGDMGFVGPRPMLPRERAYLPDEINLRAYGVTPGITGIASMVFRDEEQILSASPKGIETCYREDIAPLKADLDIWYAQNRSFPLDLQIIFFTGWMVLRPHSIAYSRLLGRDWLAFAERIDSLYRSAGLPSPFNKLNQIHQPA